jgi:hypothetical protein
MLLEWPESDAELDRVKQARHSVERVRLGLLRPSVEAFDSAAADLTAAVECLGWLGSNPPLRARRGDGSERTLQAEISGLRGDLQKVNALVESAGKFFEGWGRLVSGDAEDGPSNYTAAGTTRPPAARPGARLVLHG